MSRNTFRGPLPHVAEMRRILAVMEGMSDVVATLPEVVDGAFTCPMHRPRSAGNTRR